MALLCPPMARFSTQDQCQHSEPRCFARNVSLFLGAHVGNERCLQFKPFKGGCHKSDVLGPRKATSKDNLKIISQDVGGLGEGFFIRRNI